MITLFRRIRQKLIDSGNITKYLLYAIGEILLVVIGILIALQVNNWNEERRAIEDEKFLLGEVMEALQADSLALEELSAKMDSTFSVYKTLYRISEGDLSPDSLSKTDLMRSSAAVGPVSKANYPDLAANVINSDVKNQVFEYYQVLSIWQYVVDEYNRYIEEKMRPFLGENEFLDYGYHHEGLVGREGKINNDKLIKSLVRSEVQQVFFEATQKTRNYVGLYDRILNEREDLIDEIERAYDND